MPRSEYSEIDGNGAGRCGRQGSIIVYLVLALVAFGVLAMAGVTRFGASVTSVLSPNCATASRYMAESGMRYAVARLRACTTPAQVSAAVTALDAHTFTVDADKGLSFTLGVSYITATKTASITSTGKGCVLAAPVTSTATDANVYLPNVANPVDPTTVTVTFSSDLVDFNIAAAGTSGAITKNTSTQSVSLGNNIPSANAAVWYGGTNALCNNGACTIGNGFCATYTMKFNPYSSTQGDGIVWTVMNGSTNTLNSFGGGGENIGYAGTAADGNQIYPPKFGMEFDITPNYKNCGKVCSKTEQLACDDGTDSKVNDHVAFMFWGNQTLSCNAAMDDHIHAAGAGTSSEPYNSYNFDGSKDGYDGYYLDSSASSSGVWLRSSGSYKTYYIRYELDRATTPNAQGNYEYTQRSWLSTSASAIRSCSQSMTTRPSLERAVALPASMHNQMASAYFGWTVGSGAYSELVNISAFALTFKGVHSPTLPTVASDYVAYFPFNEGVGATTTDISSNAHVGTLSGAYMWTPDVRTTNSASIFVTDASSPPGIVTVPSSNSLKLTTAGTISCWVKMRSNKDNAGLVHKGTRPDFNDESYSLQFAGDGESVMLYVNNGSFYPPRATSSTQLNVGQWYHVAATWNSSKLYIYINGVQVGSANSGGVSARTNDSALLIGAQANSSSYLPFDGEIDDVIIYNTALTSAQIALLAGGSHYK